MALPRLLYRSDVFRFYRYPDGAARNDAPMPPTGYTCEQYGPGDRLPSEVASFAMPGGMREVMWWRFRRGLATLLLVRSPNGRPAAFGWVQSWRPFRRRFRAISRGGRMLGFYRTDPAHRGRGVYHFLLRRSVAMAPAHEPLLIYAERDNEPSLRGIERAGFVFVAEVRVRRVLGLFSSVRVLARGGES